MSVLTKIFVVLVTFLSVILVGLVVPFVAKTDDYREQYKTVQGAKLKADTKARTLQSDIVHLQQGHSASLLLASETERKLMSELTQVNLVLDEARTDLNRVKEKNEQLVANTIHLTEAIKQSVTFVQSQRDELDKYRTLYADAKQREVELDERIDDLDSQRQSIMRQVRRFKEEQSELEAQLAKLTDLYQQVPAATRLRIEGDQDTGAEVVIVPDQPIHGRVTMVKQHGEATFVELDVGANDGVEVNMRFWVHRGNQYLASVVIVKVDTDACAGQVRISREDIVKGDSVLTGNEDL